MKLPPPSTLSSSVVSFLDDRLRTPQDLSSKAPGLASELRAQCLDLERALLELNSRLGSGLLAYASSSDRVNCLFADVSSSLTSLCSLTSTPPLDGGGGGRVWGQELPELARVEMVRSYAETALKVDALVGDIEDAVSSTLSQNLRKQSSMQSSEGIRQHAIERLGHAEDVLTLVSKEHPQWKRLVLAVDQRVDRALAILRPQAIADHRNLLASLGWPPPLSTLTSSNVDMGKSAEVLNPLLTLQGDLRQQYFKNFLALCHLQGLQRRRKSRQLKGHYREVAMHQPLWAIEELVHPISISCQKKFVKWIDKPEFMFTLVYKIARDYVDTMDELLQPLVDEARLVGYSCREEWISTMVSSLSMYLAREIFPRYIDDAGEDSDALVRTKANTSFLHLIDLMIAFDKQIRLLVAQSGILLSLGEDGSMQKISSLSVFSDRPDWIDIWAEIELNDALEKLKHIIDDERNWTGKFQGEALISDVESFKTPAVSITCLQCLSLVIDRCQPLPAASLRLRFLKLVGVPVIHTFLDRVLLRCQEAEGMTALTDDDALIKVMNSINAAHYFESDLRKRSEDVFFLEIAFDHLDEPETPLIDNEDMEGPIDDTSGGVFDEEMQKLEKFREEWVEKISVVILRGFEAGCREYVKNKKQWRQEKSEGDWTFSTSLVKALDYLQGKITVVQEYLNRIDFIVVWRSLAAGIDRIMFNGVVISNSKFYDGGVERFSCDLKVLFGVFGSCCLRPESFFPKLSEGLKLLKMGERQLQDSLKDVGKWIKDKGIRHLGVAEVEKIVNNRVFMS